MTKKFELTDEHHPDDPRLRRIRALADIPSAGVRNGDLGGWLQHEENLSHAGSAWVFGSARVFGSAGVFGSARVSGSAWVFDSAEVFGSARVFGSAWVFGSARVFDSARVSGLAQVSGSAQVFDSAQVSGSAQVFDSAEVSGSARVSDSAQALHALVEASSTFRATLVRTAVGHRLRVGCWEGTVPAFRAMIESDEWVEASAETRAKRRPELLAFAALCEARIATWSWDDVEAVES